MNAKSPPAGDGSTVEVALETIVHVTYAPHRLECKSEMDAKLNIHT